MKSVERALKNLGLGTFRLFFGSEKLAAIPEGLKNPKRILVVRSDARLGNLVFSLPFVAALKKKFPQAEISFLVSAQFAELLKNESGLDVLTFNKKKARNPLYVLDLMSRLQTKRFDWCFDLSSPQSPSFTNSFLSGLCRAPVRMAYRSKYAEAFDNLLFEPDKDSALWSQFLKLLEKVSFGKAEFGAVFTLTTDEKRKAAEVYGQSGALRVGIFLGGRGDKRWETEKWLDAAEQLAGWGCEVFLFYGPEEKCGRSKVVGRSSVRWVEPHPIREFAALLSELDLFAAVDSGPLHLASALNVPVLGVYFSSDPVRFAPMGERKTVLVENKVILTPERVAETMMEILETAEGKPAQRGAVPVGGR
ncbi:MAG: glycosyltransferase family 9 protein [candidate division Zixibacteria bacterium]|nr:glycosyltransferase family 9 protein [candidate division Zixibacteria bacterium]MCI0595008.1 glycosyltransferase family 9 protein [candidate division Zixibacteria bacterium]